MFHRVTSTPPATSGLILAIETSNPSSWTPATTVMPGVAIASLDDPSRPLATAACDPRSRDETLMQAVDAAFRSLGASPANLRRIVVSVGPGGFTALRVAITVAKSLSLTTGAATVAVPSAFVAAKHAAKSAQSPFAVALASKGEDCWLTAFDAACKPTNPSKPGFLATARDLADLGIARLVADQHLPESIRAEATTLGITIELPTFDPACCLAAAAELPDIDPLSLNLIYARMPEAVRKWRELHGENSVAWPTP